MDIAVASWKLPLRLTYPPGFPGVATCCFPHRVQRRSVSSFVDDSLTRQRWPATAQRRFMSMRLAPCEAPVRTPAQVICFRCGDPVAGFRSAVTSEHRPSQSGDRPGGWFAGSGRTHGCLPTSCCHQAAYARLPLAARRAPVSFALRSCVQRAQFYACRSSDSIAPSAIVHAASSSRATQ